MVHAEPGDLVLVACSGGADSLALAAATGFEGPKRGLVIGGITVDHALQEGSAERAATVVDVLGGLGLDPVEVARVEVSREGGPEAAARRARYEALDEATDRLGAKACLLGHTLDDQAETVLLGLTRGSGARSLAGMPAASGHYLRPLLHLDRACTRAACLAEGLSPWEDPHNIDPAYTRSRIRHRVLPVLEDELGPGVTEALARTARQLRADADLLDAWSDRAYVDCRRVRVDAHETGGAHDADAAGGRLALDVEDLRALPTAIRRRVLRRAALEAGSPAADLFAVHVEAIDALVVDWHGQSRVDLPGGVNAWRRTGGLGFDRRASIR